MNIAKRISKLEARITHLSQLPPDTIIVNHRGEREVAGKRVRLDRFSLDRWKKRAGQFGSPVVNSTHG